MVKKASPALFDPAPPDPFDSMTTARFAMEVPAALRLLAQSSDGALKRLKHRCKLLHRYWLCSHRPYTPLFVLATYRSGSNLLIDYLSKLPQVQCYAEVLSPWLAIGPPHGELSAKQALRHIRYSLQSLKAPIRGCKLMLDQLTACRLSPADLRNAFGTAKFVILYRQSLAEQLLSCRSAQVTQQWTAPRGQTPRLARVAIDPVELKWYCLSLRRLYEGLLANDWLRECSALISYEQLAADPRRVLAEQVCPLLNISPVEPRTMLQKQNPQPLHERLLNYEQLAPLLNLPECRQSYAWPSAA